MSELSHTPDMTADPAQLFSATLERERDRLRNWVRRNVADREEAEDILQDVFVELYQAYRLLQPIEDAGAWLFRVARNRVTDVFRRKRPEALADQVAATDESDAGTLEDLLPSAEAGPESVHARDVLVEALEDALDALPGEWRDVFLAHEVEGLSFKEISARTRLPVSTLVSRKYYAVQRLRRRLQAIHDELQEL